MQEKHDTCGWKEYFEKEAARYKNLNTFLTVTLNEHNPVLMRITENTPEKGKILEIGCGTCFNSIFLSYLGYKTTAIDIDDSVIEYAKKMNNKLKGNVLIEKGDGFKLRYRDNSFDTVFHQGLLEHFDEEDVIKMLNESHRISKTAVFVVPGRIAKELTTGVYGDERLMTLDQWKNIIKKSKWKIKETFWFSLLVTPKKFWRIIYKHPLFKPKSHKIAVCLGFVLIH